VNDNADKLPVDPKRNELNPVTLIGMILRAILEESDFRAIRLVDGEGMVLAYDYPSMARDVERKQRIWFGDYNLELKDWEEI